MTKAKTETITWHNEPQTFVIEPNPDAPEMVAQSVEVQLYVGRTVPEAGKRASWRVKAHSDGAEFDPQTNAVKAASEVIKAKFGGTKHHDVKGAVADFAFPDMSDETDEEKVKNWQDLDNVEELRSERDLAVKAAQRFFAGEADMREGLYELCQHVSNVAESLGTPTMFRHWVESSQDADLQRALKNQNAKSEYMFVGRLPKAWFDLQPETTNSPKAYQLRFNTTKNEFADNVAQEAWGKKAKTPTPSATQKALFTVLSDVATLPEDGDASDGRKAMALLADDMLSFLNAASEQGDIQVFDKDDDGNVIPAKDKNGDYIAGTQFGTGKRPHELVLSVCKAIKANAPEAKAEAEKEAQEREATKAVRPKSFAEYTPKKAAMHLCNILQAHDDWNEVLGFMNDFADRAEKDGWTQVLADVAANISAEEAEAEKAEAEESADDDA